MERCERESHTRIVPSSDAEAMCRLLGEQTTDQIVLECPVRGLPMTPPVRASQIRMVLSSDAEMMCCPSEE